MSDPIAEQSIRELSEELATTERDRDEWQRVAAQRLGTRSWAKVESLKLDQVKIGRDRIWEMSRGHRYGEEPGAEPDDGGWVSGDKTPANQATGIELAEEPAAAVGE